LLKKEIFQKNYRYILFSIIIIISITIIGFAYFSNLDIFFAINFNLARIFLTNDTRALAIDLAYLKGFENGNIFIESLRGLSTKLFGSTPEFPPIGVYLYQYFFNVDSFMGGNASTSALLILFGSSEDKIIFFFLTIIILFILIMLPNIVKGKRFFYYLMSSYCVVLLSQDFLSFQVVFIILVIFIIKDILFIGLINNTKKKNNYV